MALSGSIWRKSSHSSHDGGECVEVARNLPGVVLVRDSKNPDGPVLVFAPEEWRGLITAIKSEHR